MIIVSGHLSMDAAARSAYLEGCVAVVEAARQAVITGADVAEYDVASWRSLTD